MRFTLHWQQRRQLKAQLPVFMRTLGSTLKADYSVSQALQFSASEMSEPL